MHLTVQYVYFRRSRKYNKIGAVWVQTVRSLTERQRSVLERIDRRVPIKMIAQELGISETRINQHIRALKDIYRTESLNELVALYRLDQSDEASQDRHDQSAAYGIEARTWTGFTDRQSSALNRVIPNRTDNGTRGYWASRNAALEPKALIGWLDGRNAIWNRLGFIAAVFSLLLSSTILSVAAVQFVLSAL